MTLKELRKRYRSGEKQMKSVKAQIKEQVKRKCAQRGCDESLAFKTRTRVLCDTHKHIKLSEATTTNSKKRARRYTKAQLKAVNKAKKKAFYKRHGITFNKTVRKRNIPPNELGTGIAYTGQTLLYEDYKEPLKPIEKTKGYGFYGTVALTDDKKYVQCHICGHLFENLGMHLRKHKILATDYKERYGLAQGTSLVSETVRESMQRTAIKLYDGKLPDHLIEYNRKVQSGEIKHRPSDKHKRWSLEKRNKLGMCPDQVLEKIREAADILGHTPSEEEFKKFYNYRYYGSITYQHGSYLKAVKKLGLKSAKEVKEHTTEDLLQELRDFKEKHGRIPMTSDFSRGLLPSRGTYFARFGSLNNARIGAGLNAVLPMPFGQIVEMPPDEYIKYKSGQPAHTNKGLEK